MLEEKCKIGGHSRRRDYVSDKKKSEAEQRLLLRTAQNLICSPSRTAIRPQNPPRYCTGGSGSCIAASLQAETASQQFSGQNGRTDVQVRLA